MNLIDCEYENIDEGLVKDFKKELEKVDEQLRDVSNFRGFPPNIGKEFTRCSLPEGMQLIKLHKVIKSVCY